jgi:hypothetical protein
MPRHGRRKGQFGPVTTCAVWVRETSLSGSDVLVVLRMLLARIEPQVSKAMDDPYDLVLSMFGVAIAAVMLVAGELYLVMRPDPPHTYTPPPVVTSSID